MNSILRWVPQAGREIILMLTCEYIDVNGNLTFQTVSGDLTFKFSYTFRY